MPTHRGVVKYFSIDKFYGFISRVDERDVFFHGSAVEHGLELKSDDAVVFNVMPDAKSGRDKAVNVRLELA